MNLPDLQATIERAKAEILADVRGGVVPLTCGSFSELHDFVDANGYGGAFEVSPVIADDDSNLSECHAFTDFWNDVQNTLDAWIKAGGILEACCN